MLKSGFGRKEWRTHMQTILVPLDGSPFSEHALPAAMTLARRSGATLVLAHVHQIAVPAIAMAGEVTFDTTLDSFMRNEERGYLEGVFGRVSAIHTGTVRCDLLEAPVAAALIDHVQATRADLVVMSTHGRGGMARAWLGSVTDRMIRQSPAPVLVIHPLDETVDLAAEPPLQHIVIPLDGSPEAETAVDVARSIGTLTNAHYTLIQVLEPAVHTFALDGVRHDPEPIEGAWEQAQAYLNTIAAPLRAAGCTVDIQTPLGQPVAELLLFIEQNPVDVVALTTHGRAGVARMLLGSVADKLVRGARVPVLISCTPSKS
jgi:nucleotide-binding universal stress UspA family protein